MTDNQMTRRQSFAAVLGSVLGPAALAPAPSGGKSPLIWMLDTYGDDAVAEAFSRLMAERGSITLRELRKDLFRTARREGRQAVTRQRRERNADEVLIRAPVEWGDLTVAHFREVRNRCRRRMAVLSTNWDLSLGEHSIPAGSRVLIDMRAGDIPATPICELVRTRDGSIRCHLWPFRGQIDREVRSFTIPVREIPRGKSSHSEADLFSIQEEMERAMA